MSKAKLVDNLTKKEHTLKSRILRVGRKADNDIVITNRIVSKYHFEIRKSLSGYSIADSGSTHGFYVNRERVNKERKLHDGDRIQVIIIYADKPPDPDDTGTSTFVARPQAVAKQKLDGTEENTSVACDFTFHMEAGTGIFGFFGKK